MARARVVDHSKDATLINGAAAVKLLDEIAGRERSMSLTDKDRNFILDMRGKAQRAGSGFVCSLGQVGWLTDIRDKLAECGE